MKLFVYGTLITGEKNHKQLESATFLEKAQTASMYTLRDLKNVQDCGDYPGLFNGGCSSVLGEVYEVSEALLAILDEFEGHPDFYLRDTVQILNFEDETVHTYFFPEEKGKDGHEILSGDWVGHRKAR